MRKIREFSFKVRPNCSGSSFKPAPCMNLFSQSSPPGMNQFVLIKGANTSSSLRSYCVFHNTVREQVVIAKKSPFNNMLMSQICFFLNCPMPLCQLPVIVAVTQRPDRDFKSLPHRIQSILHHFCFVADGKSVRHRKTLTNGKIL